MGGDDIWASHLFRACSIIIFIERHDRKLEMLLLIHVQCRQCGLFLLGKEMMRVVHSGKRALDGEEVGDWTDPKAAMFSKGTREQFKLEIL